MSTWEPDPRFDLRPSQNPYPSSLPDWSTAHKLPQTDVHLSALHATDKQAHEDAVLVDGGDRSRLPNLQRAILENKALREELGTSVVTIPPRSQGYLDMDGPTNTTA